MKTALVISYSQTGQLTAIVHSVTAPLKSDFDLAFEDLKPVPAYPFPWTAMQFFQAFPESVKEIPCKLEPFRFNPEDHYDLVILAYQVWYLSPSIPFIAFLQSQEAKRLLRGKPVITILGVRNMWMMAQERVKQYIRDSGGRLVGNIVLVDPYPNLVSVFTIVRWLMKGERKGSGTISRMFPRAGVPDKVIEDASRFGEVIRQAFDAGDPGNLQTALLEKGAVKINPVLMNIEKRGKMMFGFWSGIVLKKGGYGDHAREGRLRLFKYYLFTVIYLVSPIVSIIFWVLSKIFHRYTRRQIDYFSGVQ
jgi:hypothetical protein